MSRWWPKPRVARKVIELSRQVEIDLLLLDMNMPGISGEILIARLYTQYPELPILVLSMHNEIHIAQRALRAGAATTRTATRDPVGCACE